MAQLKRIARSKSVPGVGYARRGVIHTVPDGMVDALLKTKEWERVGKAEAQRVTEPAPSEPAASAQASKPKAKSKKK